MKRMILTFGSALLTAFASLAADYTVTLPLTEDEDGLIAYLVDYDNGQKVDSTLVEGGKAVFKNSIESPLLVRLLLGQNRGGVLILEDGNITVNSNGYATGTPLNDGLTAFNNDQQKILADYQALPKDATDEQKQQIIERYEQLPVDVFQANGDNPLGYFCFLQKAYELEYPTFMEYLAKYPTMEQYQRVKTLKQKFINKEETSVGHKFKDFEITYNGETKKLSDYVGKGKYTIVDFWASWCGPCIRQTKVLKELWNKYKDNGLDFLGVAVWEEPEATLKGIEQHELPWPQIINAQSIPTDIYGISGIPCIILFDPEGNIVSRDKQSEELIADVDAAMSTLK